MCTLAVYYRVFDNFPLVVAANRDEYLNRAAAPPAKLLDEPAAVGGRDLVAGGTWLGINAAGLVAALLNRRSTQPADRRRRSRGLVCLEALRRRSIEDALLLAKQTEAEAYNPFNLLVATVRSAAVVASDGCSLKITMLSRGLHLLSNLEVDDRSCPRIARSLRSFEKAGRQFASSGDRDAFIRAIRAVMSDHTTVTDRGDQGPLSALCIHAGAYGTRSSTLMFCSNQGQYSYFHASGPPCREDYLPVELPF